jgi:pimeloyl-ACP methyl ester carboxylesterase
MQNLILLHGAIGAASQLDELAIALKGSYNIYTMDFSGHGGQPFANEVFSIKLFAEDTLRYLEEQEINTPSIFGYSMGGYVGMYLAKHYPEKIDKVVTLATKYEWSEAIANKEIQMLQPEKIEAKLPAFATTLRERHYPNDWKKVLYNTAEMMTVMGNNSVLRSEDYKMIRNKVLLLIGDRDKMVSVDETMNVYRLLPDAQLGILPDTAHPIEQVDTDVLSMLVKRFVD